MDQIFKDEKKMHQTFKVAVDEGCLHFWGQDYQNCPKRVFKTWHLKDGGYEQGEYDL
jgi:hypothetical protein